MSVTMTEIKPSGNANNPYKKLYRVWGATVAGGVGFEPTTASLGGLRPIHARLPALLFPLLAEDLSLFWSMLLWSIWSITFCFNNI